MCKLPPQFKVVIDHEKCRRCKRCVLSCSYGAIEFADKVVPKHINCVACHRCMSTCPEDAIVIEKFPLAYRENASWRTELVQGVQKQAATGAMLLTGMGNDKPYKIFWDHLVIDACQVTNPSIDPLREPMELRTYLGRKPDKLEFAQDKNGKTKLKTEMGPSVLLETPIVFAAMSFGSISLNAHRALARAAYESGILMNTGEGGLHKDLNQFSERVIVQVASGRFGVSQEYLNRGSIVEIKVGQGAKPGIGGHLPGEKINAEVSQTRMIPIGSDAISPAPHHDIYSIEDLRQLIYALKETTDYTKLVSVKISAVHNVAAIASGIVRAGADIVTIDGFRGGTGAAPTIIRDNVGIPIELALAAVDDRLRNEGIRNQASILAAGSIRSSGDMAKAIALGADGVVIGTAALLAMGCRVCQKCYLGKCTWGIATQQPQLVARLNPEEATQNLKNLIRAWSLELKEILGLLGVNSIESLRGNRERLRGIGLSDSEARILGVKHAGE